MCLDRRKRKQNCFRLMLSLLRGPRAGGQCRVHPAGGSTGLVLPLLPRGHKCSLASLCVYAASSVQLLSLSHSLLPRESQRARPPCPSPNPGVYSNSSIESVMPSSHLILCRPLLLLPPIPPSIRVFSSESTLRMRWPKYWSFSFSISPSNEHPGLISFRMEWLDPLAVQGTLKGLLQHHSSKAVCCS